MLCLKCRTEYLKEEFEFVRNSFPIMTKYELDYIPIFLIPQNIKSPELEKINLCRNCFTKFIIEIDERREVQTKGSSKVLTIFVSLVVPISLFLLIYGLITYRY
jgi:hypothetical protein